MARDGVVTASARFVFAVLRLAAAADAPLSIAEISRRLGVSMNKAYRAVVTLEDAGYLRRNFHTGRFETGPVAEQLVYAAFEQFQIRAAIAPYLRQIATSSRATASFSVRIGWYAVTLALIESGSDIVSRAHRLGRATLLSSDAGGVAILAWFPADELDRFCAFAAGRSPDASAAAAIDPTRLAAFRDSGFATVIGSNSQLHALGFPLRDADGRPIASITIEAPLGRSVALEADPLLRDWLDIAGQAESLVRANTEYSIGPYALLDPNLIEF